jgi:hypothetical protein
MPDSLLMTKEKPWEEATLQQLFAAFSFPSHMEQRNL